MKFYPWHNKSKDRIVQQFSDKKLAHALLFAGAAGLGKFDFAVTLGCLFLCQEQSTDDPCGHCAACHLLAAGTHPDLKIVAPEDSKQIKIEQIRALTGWVGQTAQRNGWKIAIISPAQQMNVQSANALLKCLEEPASNTLLILVSARPGSLLPTIISRCQQISFHMPDNELALNWLQETMPELSDSQLALDISGGMPLAVLNNFDENFLKRRELVAKSLLDMITTQRNPLECAVKLVKHEQEEVFTTILGILSDCARFHSSQDRKFIQNRDLARELEIISNACESQFIFSAIDRTQADLRKLQGTTNPNKILLLENLLIDLNRQQSHRIVDLSL